MNASFSPPNILVVDDINANLAVLTDMIHNAGYIARPVTSARQAVNAIEALIPDLILLDISMPEIDGFVFCSMLKKNAKTRGIPIIFISAMNSAEDRVKGLQSGAVDFITKPFEAEELILRIGIHLKMHKMQKELEIYNKKLNKTINDQIDKIYEEQKNVIHALAVMSVNRDNEIMMYLGRLGKNSRLLALSMQLSVKYKDQITNSFIDAIELSAQLLDIGKTAIKKSGLQYPDNENEVIFPLRDNQNLMAHTVLGAEILQEIYSGNESNELLKMAIDISKSHHEKWNGTGYPRGLRGIEIPLSARIVAIVDTYQTLMSNSDDKKACTHEESMQIISEGSGVFFEPDIVSIFQKIQNQLIK